MGKKNRLLGLSMGGGVYILFAAAEKELFVVATVELGLNEVFTTGGMMIGLGLCLAFFVGEEGEGVELAYPGVSILMIGVSNILLYPSA